MASPNQSEKSVALDREENITKGNLSAKRVVNYIYDPGTDTLTPDSQKIIERYDIQGTTIYSGEAPVGTSRATTGWSITKYDLADVTDASGLIATDVSWDDRATGSYA